jgi:hypothetical protein
MPNVLEVQIIGDVSGLEKSLDEAKKLQADYTASIEKTSSEIKDSIVATNGYAKAIDDLNKSYKEGRTSSADYNKQLISLKRDEKESTIVTADLRKELVNLKKDQKDLGGSFSTAGKKVADGGNALMQFSRIAQDAPYGIQGIGNNITATVEAFGYLSKSAGGTGAALKAVAGSLLGSGGILLAISLVTSGLTYMAQSGLTVEDVFAKLNGTLDENAVALSQVGAEAVKSSQAEISTMNAYVSAASNVNLSMADRLLAVKKLQSEYPAYFGNLTQEQILNGNVAGAVKGVTEALINKAKAAAFSSRIADLAEKEFILRQQEEKGINKLKDAYKALNSSQQQFQSGGGTLGATAVSGFGRLDEAKSSLQDIQNEIRSNLATQKLFTEELNKSTAASIKLDTATPKVTKSKQPKVDVTPQVTAIPKLIAVKSTDDQNDKLLQQTRDILSEDLNKLKVDGVDVKIPFQFVTEGFNFSNYAKKLEDAKKQTELFSNGAGSAINSLAGDLTKSLETGNSALDAFVGSVISGLAQIASAQLAGLIAKQAVATTSLSTDAAVSTGNAITAATETASATGPAAAFVLPALVGAAIGFIAAAFSGIKFAHGGIVPGGSFTGDKIPAMLNSGEAVMNSQQQANTLMAIANGNSNSLQSNRQNSNFTLESKLRGTDILLTVKREERKR